MREETGRDLMKPKSSNPEPHESSHAGRAHLAPNGTSHSAPNSKGENDPNLGLMEIAMPSMSGLAVTELSGEGKRGIKILVLAVHSNTSDDPSFSEDIARAALNRVISDRASREAVAHMTSRERQVLVLIAEGKTNKDIAKELGLGVRTIETHRERLMRRLNIHSVAGLIRFAITHGLVSLD